MEKIAAEEVPLGRRDTCRSITSDMARQKSEDWKNNEIDENDLGFFYLFRRIGSLAHSCIRKMGRCWHDQSDITNRYQHDVNK